MKTIVVDSTSSTSQDPHSSNPLSFNHTISTDGSNKMLIVGVSMKDKTVSGITYDSVAMTLAKKYGDRGNGEVWYLKNPHPGTHSIAITFSGTTGIVAAGAVSIKSANMSSVPNTTGGTANTSTSIITSVSPTVAGCFGVDALYSYSSTLPTVKTGQTLLKSVAGGDSCGISYHINMTTSDSMGWNTGNDENDHAVAVFAPAKNSAGFLINFI